ncbi:MAG: hypothetical protein QM484_01980 [Woeseiaceae bacterium]
MTTEEVAPSLEELGWRQCSIFLGSDLPNLARCVHDYSDDDIYIVLPYSCAVVQMDFDKEPNIELFRVRRIRKKNRGLLFGRSPRQLNIEIQGDVGVFYANGSIHDRFFIDHSLFVGKALNPTLKLAPRECSTIRNWFAKRYIRNALPTEFNRRARVALNNLRDALKSGQDLDALKAVYIILDPNDQKLGSLEEPYDVEVSFLVEESELQNAAIQKISNQFDIDLDDSEGILVSSIELRSESDVILSEYKTMIRLDDYDFISYRDGHEDPVIIQE